MLTIRPQEAHTLSPPIDHIDNGILDIQIEIIKKIVEGTISRGDMESFKQGRESGNNPLDNAITYLYEFRGLPFTKYVIENNILHMLQSGEFYNLKSFLISWYSGGR